MSERVEELERQVESLTEELAAVDDRIEMLEEREQGQRSWPSSNGGAEQRARANGVKQIIEVVEAHSDEGASVQDVHSVAAILEMDLEAVREETEKLHRQGEIYYTTSEAVRTT